MQTASAAAWQPPLWRQLQAV
ncbi:MAG: hypothetical protein RIS90_110, partial [Pseudomonadota bacterium]